MQWWTARVNQLLCVRAEWWTARVNATVCCVFVRTQSRALADGAAAHYELGCSWMIDHLDTAPLSRETVDEYVRGYRTFWEARRAPLFSSSSHAHMCLSGAERRRVHRDIGAAAGASFACPMRDADRPPA